MNQKGFVSIALIVLVVVFAGVAGYFALNNRSTTSTPTPPTSTSVKPTQMPEINSGVGTAYKDVKYFFDNIDSFNENLSRSGISESVFIKGKLVEVEFQVQCIKAPCLPVKHFALQDISSERYKIVIYQVNPLAQKLEVGRIYILKGILKKDVDFGRKVVYINNFELEEVIKANQFDEQPTSPLPPTPSPTPTPSPKPTPPVSLLRVCPEEWYDNRMPSTFGSNDAPREYFIYKGVRRELSEFDVNWVKTNCSVEPKVVY